MKDLNAALAINANLPGDLLDALDQLSDARNIAELIGMAHRYAPNSDTKAVSTGIQALLAHLNAAETILKPIAQVQK